jgi:hypothetical protein
MSLATDFRAIHAPRINRLPRNPLDKCTIVSVYPRQLIEEKPTMFPGRFVIPAAPENDFSLLVVGGSSWFREMTDDQPMLEIPISSVSVAEGIIRDYSNSLLGYVPDKAAPGIFFIPGEFTKKTIITYKNEVTGKTFLDLLNAAKTKQKEWFGNLVRIADTLWSRTNGNPLTISDDAKMAAQYLKLNDKPWLADFQSIQKEACKACGNLVNPMYPVCPNCKAIINAEKAKELGLSFAV